MQSHFQFVYACEQTYIHLNSIVVITRPVRGMGAWCIAPRNSTKCRRTREGWWPFPHHSNSRHPISAQVATIDKFPSVDPYCSLGRRLRYSVPMKHGGQQCSRLIECSQSFLIIGLAINFFSTQRQQLLMF